MFKKISQMLNKPSVKEEDEVLMKRFARLKTRFKATSNQDKLDCLSHIRSNLDQIHVVGRITSEKELNRRQMLLSSCLNRSKRSEQSEGS